MVEDVLEQAMKPIDEDHEMNRPMIKIAIFNLLIFSKYDTCQNCQNMQNLSTPQNRSLEYVQRCVPIYSELHH